MDGCYHLVCGGIEAGETALEAAVREAEEESGIVIKEEDLHFHSVVEKVHAAQRHVLFFFLAKRWEGTVVNKEPHKCRSLLFLISTTCLTT
jgi:ADP-ribose pyrophosphatase YjhB (NUDIX family)